MLQKWIWLQLVKIFLKTFNRFLKLNTFLNRIIHGTLPLNFQNSYGLQAVHHFRFISKTDFWTLHFFCDSSNHMTKESSASGLFNSTNCCIFWAMILTSFISGNTAELSAIDFNICRPNCSGYFSFLGLYKHFWYLRRDYPRRKVSAIALDISSSFLFFLYDLSIVW